MSANGIECRFPFLDWELVQFGKQIPCELLTDFTRPRGSGDKVFLRQLAERLGLKESSLFRKKAIQFGTKLAKQSNIQKFGSNRKAKGNAEYKTKKGKKAVSYTHLTLPTIYSV
eukprot:TRINITY_DN16158_c0_g1_i1.p2 TRINITY_DN16158_c0_g1~~TRINITY_DN16158_c0_g1_i1.p2  ORF type:complete len:114 (-),score=23.91 TRINITY_DN16158_c0_g1_i1:31-372(-)